MGQASPVLGFEPARWRRHLMQLPDVLHAERDLPKKSWIGFSGSGKPRKPKPNQFEIFVEGRK